MEAPQGIAIFVFSPDDVSALNELKERGVVASKERLERLAESNWEIRKLLDGEIPPSKELVRLFPVDLSEAAPPIPIFLPPKRDGRCGSVVFEKMFSCDGSAHDGRASDEPASDEAAHNEPAIDKRTHDEQASDAAFCEQFRSTLTEASLKSALGYAEGTRTHPELMLRTFCVYNPIVATLKRWHDVCAKDPDADVPDRVILSLKRLALPIDLDFPALGDFNLRCAFAQRSYEANRPQREAAADNFLKLVSRSLRYPNDRALKEVLDRLEGVTADERRKMRLARSNDKAAFLEISENCYRLTFVFRLLDRLVEMIQDYRGEPEKWPTDESFKAFDELLDSKALKDDPYSDAVSLLGALFDFGRKDPNDRNHTHSVIERWIRKNAKKTNARSALLAGLEGQDSLVPMIRSRELEQIGRYRELWSLKSDKNIKELTSEWVACGIARRDGRRLAANAERFPFFETIDDTCIVFTGGEDFESVPAFSRRYADLRLKLARKKQSESEKAAHLFSGTDSARTSQKKQPEQDKVTSLASLLPHNVEVSERDLHILSSLDGFDLENQMVRITRVEKVETEAGEEELRDESNLWVAGILEAGPRGFYLLGAEINLVPSKHEGSLDFGDRITRSIVRLRDNDECIAMVGDCITEGALTGALPMVLYNRMADIVFELEDDMTVFHSPACDAPLEITITLVDDHSQEIFERYAKAMNMRMRDGSNGRRRSDDGSEIEKCWCRKIEGDDGAVIRYRDGRLLGKNEFSRFLRWNANEIEDVVIELDPNQEPTEETDGRSFYIWNETEQFGLGWTQRRVLRAYAEAIEGGRISSEYSISISEEEEETRLENGEGERRVRYPR